MAAKLFLFTCSFFVFTMLSSFKSQTSTEFTAKVIQQKMTKVSDNLYASKYEVSNAEYSGFLDFMKTKDALLAEKYKVDSAKWITNSGYSEPLAKYYHLHPSYKNYPVVNISYEAAMAYCNWLTEQYNADSKKKFSKVEFFLPSEEQWMVVANGGNKMYPWGNYYLRNRTGQFLCNFKRMGDESITYNETTKEYKVVPVFQGVSGGLNDRAFYTAEVNSFEPVAPYGINNMSGNVAEMVSEKGIAKGGSYNSPGYDVRIQSKMNYTDASPEVGFRVFMKVLEF